MKNFKNQAAYDREFVIIMNEVGEIGKKLSKNDQFYIEKWIHKLCLIQTDINMIKIRNSYAQLLLNTMKKHKIAPIFYQLPPTNSLTPLDHETFVNENSSSFITKRIVETSAVIQKNKETLQKFTSKDQSPPYHSIDQSIRIDTSQLSGRYSINPDHAAKKHYMPINKKREDENENYSKNELSIQVNKSNIDLKKYVSLKNELELSKINEQGLFNELELRKQQNDDMLQKNKFLLEENSKLKTDLTFLKNILDEAVLNIEMFGTLENSKALHITEDIKNSIKELPNECKNKSVNLSPISQKHPLSHISLDQSSMTGNCLAGRKSQGRAMTYSYHYISPKFVEETPQNYEQILLLTKSYYNC